jgi:hypothetical protein
MLAGTPLDVTEARLRAAVLSRRDNVTLAADHPLQRALLLLRERHSRRFSEFDGNLAALAGDGLVPRGYVSPTSLEHYAGCGMRYFLNSVLRLRPPDEPEDRDTIDPRDKGTLVHEVLDAFYRRRLAEGRPALNEVWTDADRVELLALLEQQLEETRHRGKTGLDIYSDHQRRRLRAELTTFLDADSDFRLETGAVPHALEVAIPALEFEGITMRGTVDRIDMTPDGRKAWVLDYKTGSVRPYEKMKDDDPLAGGTKLQLPVYLAAVPDAEEVEAFYWFISTAGEFKRIPFLATPANRQRYRETLSAILTGVRAGAFPANPGDEGFYGFDNCTYCDFNKLCSVRRDDEFEFKHGDSGLIPWSSVATTAKGGPP